MQGLDSEFPQPPSVSPGTSGAAAATIGGLGPTAVAPVQAIVSPTPSPSVATDSRHASGTTSYLTHEGSNSGKAAAGQSQHRAFGKGVAAIFNTAGASLGGTALTSFNPGGSASLSPNDEDSALSSGTSAEEYPQTAGGPPIDPLGRQVTTALPSYLKIPTLIPSRQSQPLAPTVSAPSSPTASSVASTLGSGNATPGSSGWSGVAGAAPGAGKATSAVLTTEDVVLAPGSASRVSSPADEHRTLPTVSSDGRSDTRIQSAETGEVTPQLTPTIPDGSQSDTALTDAYASDLATEDEGGKGGTISLSRTPTPTQKSRVAKALTPARLDQKHAPTSDDLMRQKVHIATGVASGATTPVMPIPPGLTSAPPSAVTPPVSTAGRTTSIPAGNESGAGLSIDTTLSNAAAGLSAGPAASLSSGQKTPTGSSSRSSDQVGSTTPKSRQPPISLTPYYTRDAKGPISLMPIVLTWRGGGKDVFVTGTFANEWRSKILLKRSHGSGSASQGWTAGSGNRRSGSAAKGEEHSVVLHLPPGTHRMKFIVDDRWRVSRELPTASDGDGNLVNYLEIPNVGPAHPGPLSAPGEDLLDDESRERERRTERAVERIKDAERAGKRRPASQSSNKTASTEESSFRSGIAEDTTADITASTQGSRSRSSSPMPPQPATDGEISADARRRHAVLDLQEEARKAELIKRGQLEEVFGIEDEALRAAETWVQDVPETVIRAQAAEEAYRDRIESGAHDGGAAIDEEEHQQHLASVPPPPSLPRQLEKVILNSSPANPALAPPGGLVDDNSILPAPNHVVLNHLTASAIKGGVLAVGTTTRYKRKYVTTVFYRPVQT